MVRYQGPKAMKVWYVKDCLPSKKIIIISKTQIKLCTTLDVILYIQCLWKFQLWNFNFISLSIDLGFVIGFSWQLLFLYFSCIRLPPTSAGKESICNTGNPGSILEMGRSPGEGNGNPHQYFCLENPMDRGAWQATNHGITESDTT